jgi:hypothetical protein
MDSKTFDTLTRGFGSRRTRRHALKGLAIALVGLGGARSAAAQITAQRATCGQRCELDADCNAGLRCSRPQGSNGICVAELDSRTACNNSSGCSRNFEACRNGRCVNVLSSCTRCNVTGDCPSGEVCRRGNCGECRNDNQCPGRQVCRNGRCRRDRDECNNNRDCPRNRVCRRGRCVRRD